MASASGTRTIAASLDQLWEVVSDPYHLPRWWPRVERVEDVRDDAFTEVMLSSRGRSVRADFDIALADAGSRTLRWEQRVRGTPFAAVLDSSQTEVRLTPAPRARAQVRDEGVSMVAPLPAGDATEVTIEMRQQLRGRGGVRGRAGTSWLRSRMVRRAAAATIERALDGLEQISA